MSFHQTNYNTRVRFGACISVNNASIFDGFGTVNMGTGSWWASTWFGVNSGNRRASLWYYRKTSNISRTLVGNKIVDNSDVVGASPVGAAPTTSSFSTQHLASMDWAKTTARGYKIHLSFGIWCDLYKRFYGTITAAAVDTICNYCRNEMMMTTWFLECKFTRVNSVPHRSHAGFYICYTPPHFFFMIPSPNNQCTKNTSPINRTKNVTFT